MGQAGTTTVTATKVYTASALNIWSVLSLGGDGGVGVGVGGEEMGREGEGYTYISTTRD